MRAREIFVVAAPSLIATAAIVAALCLWGVLTVELIVELIVRMGLGFLLGYALVAAWQRRVTPWLGRRKRRRHYAALQDRRSAIFDRMRHISAVDPDHHNNSEWWALLREFVDVLSEQASMRLNDQLYGDNSARSVRFDEKTNT